VRWKDKFSSITPLQKASRKSREATDPHGTASRNLIDQNIRGSIGLKKCTDNFGFLGLLVAFAVLGMKRMRSANQEYV
jgi:hypothetical protein